MHQSAYWVLGHFARFVEPGAERVLTVAAEPLETTAFTHADGRTTVVAANRHDEALRFALCIDDGAGCAVELPPHSIATFVARPA
jgi:glucosylceramidase